VLLAPTAPSFVCSFWTDYFPLEGKLGDNMPARSNHQQSSVRSIPANNSQLGAKALKELSLEELKLQPGQAPDGWTALLVEHLQDVRPVQDVRPESASATAAKPTRRIAEPVPPKTAVSIRPNGRAPIPNPDLNLHGETLSKVHEHLDHLRTQFPFDLTNHQRTGMLVPPTMKHPESPQVQSKNGVESEPDQIISDALQRGLGIQIATELAESARHRTWVSANLPKIAPHRQRP